MACRKRLTRYYRTNLPALYDTSTSTLGSLVEIVGVGYAHGTAYRAVGPLVG